MTDSHMFLKEKKILDIFFQKTLLHKKVDKNKILFMKNVNEGNAYSNYLYKTLFEI